MIPAKGVLLKFRGTTRLGVMYGGNETLQLYVHSD